MKAGLKWCLPSQYDITQRSLVITYRRFGTAGLRGCSAKKMGSIGCPQTSVSNYQSTLRNISEEGKPHLHRGGSLKQNHTVGKNPSTPNKNCCKETRQSNLAGSVGSPTGYGQFILCKLDSRPSPTDKPNASHTNLLFKQRCCTITTIVSKTGGCLQWRPLYWECVLCSSLLYYTARVTGLTEKLKGIK